MIQNISNEDMIRIADREIETLRQRMELLFPSDWPNQNNSRWARNKKRQIEYQIASYEKMKREAKKREKQCLQSA